MIPKDPLIGKQIGDYKIDKTLGRGSFGAVYLAINIKTYGLFAIKKMDRKRILASKKLTSMLSREVNIMDNLDHPNIIKIYELLQNDDFFYLILDYCEEGQNLFFYLIKKIKWIRFFIFLKFNSHFLNFYYDVFFKMK